MAEGSAKKAAKRYRSFLEKGDYWEATDQLRKLAVELSEETDASPGGAVPLKPSKTYKAMRAILQDSTTLDLLFTRALAIPQTENEAEKILLVSNLVSLQIAVGFKEFLELCLRNGFLDKMNPLLLHTVDWLGTERFLKGGEDERRIVGTLLQIVLKAANADIDRGISFVTESGLLTKLRAQLPWKAQPKLDPEMAAEVSEILLNASGLVTMSVLVTRDRAEIAARFASDDVTGWLQSALLWAGAAAEKSARARAPLDSFVSGTFLTLAQTLQTFPMEAPQLKIDLQKFAPAKALAEKLKGDVSGAKAFLESLAQARALQGGAQNPAGSYSARFQKAAQNRGADGKPKPVGELTPGQRFVDTRDPRDVIGVNGDLMGVREDDEQFSGQIEWGHVIKTLESGEEKSIDRLLPTLAAFCVASAAGEINHTKVQRPPKAWAENLVALLESGRCESLWQKPGVLGSYFSILHGAMCREEYLSFGGFSEDWFLDLGARLMAWLYARADRLCLQALLMSCTLMEDVTNFTWAMKLQAVQKAHYLEFGFSVFQLLDRFATSASLAANTLLWQAATSYMTALLRPPASQQGPPTADVIRKLKSLEDTCLQKGILEWALNQCEVDWRKNPKHKMLLCRIALMASQNESGREKFDTCPKAFGILVAEAEYVRAHALMMQRVGLYPQNAPPRESAARIADVAACLERLTWLLMTFSALALDASGARARARWSEFRAAEGLPLLQRVLGDKETLQKVASEHVKSQLGAPLEEGFSCAEKLWRKAAGESGLKKCSNPRCTSVELVKGEFKRCGRCKGESYCGQACQATHWRQGHKQACRQISEA